MTALEITDFLVNCVATQTGFTDYKELFLRYKPFYNSF